MSLDDLMSKFAASAIQRSGCWLLDTERSLEFIDGLAEAGSELHGLEGYWLHGETMEPSLENSISFGGGDMRAPLIPGDTPIEKARAFVQARRGLGLYFDFDLEV